VGRKTVELMTASHPSPGLLEVPPAMGYGLGIGVLLDPAQAGCLGSAGNLRWSGWANTHFWIDPHEELIGVLLRQYVSRGIHTIIRDFETRVYQALMD
jgi:CubicO group peptidase (beta-lactamase class C family)